MLKLLVLTALIGAPIALPVGMAVFAASRWCLKRGWRAVCLLALAALAVGMAYGMLRFGGVIMLPGDNGYSVNWFDVSHRDDGFKYLYGCATFAVGIAAAFRSKPGSGKETDQ